MICKTKSPKETQKIATGLARKIARSKPQKIAALIALEGELGAGKTTFIQGFAKALKIKQRITSPTFVLIKRYPIKLPLGNCRAGKLQATSPDSQKRIARSRLSRGDPSSTESRRGREAGEDPRQGRDYKFFYHIDAFRLKNWRELVLLGAKEIFASPENIVLIEWAERVRPILPKKRIWIHIDHLDKKSRKIKITWQKN